jgi:hypothetical protein
MPSNGDKRAAKSHNQTFKLGAIKTPFYEILVLDGFEMSDIKILFIDPISNELKEVDDSAFKLDNNGV